MRKHKIPLEKVQKAFNDAIKRRDGRCMISDFEPCFGGLEASHYHTVGSSPALRFYPPNAYAQCSRHHWSHHNKKEWTDKYYHWMAAYHYDDEQRMEKLRHMFIKYTDELKAEIIRLCKEDKLNELTALVEKELGVNGKAESSNEN